jgi:hypothetical protein
MRWRAHSMGSCCYWWVRVPLPTVRAPSTSTSTTPPRLATGAPHDTRAMAELVTHMSVWYRARP